MIYTVIKQSGFECPFCDKAIQLLDRKGLSYRIRPLERAHLIREATKYGMNTVPIILQDDELIGGYDELDKILS
jgi:glutaredoxin